MGSKEYKALPTNFEQLDIGELRSSFSQLGIANVVVDIDGTILDTYSGGFDPVREKYVESLWRLAKNNKKDVYEDFIVGEGVVDQKAVRDVWAKMWKGLSEQYGANKAAHLITDRNITMMFGLDPDSDDVRQLSSRLWDGYFKSVLPDIHEARQTVELIKSGEVDLYAHSHADQAWTDIKMGGHWKGAFKGIYLTGVDEVKDSIAWKSSFEHLGIDPESVLVVGDSLRSDILPSLDAGALLTCWISFGRDINEELVKELKGVPGDRIELLKSKIIASNQFYRLPQKVIEHARALTL